MESAAVSDATDKLTEKELLFRIAQLAGKINRSKYKNLPYNRPKLRPTKKSPQNKLWLRNTTKSVNTLGSSTSPKTNNMQQNDGTNPTYLTLLGDSRQHPLNRANWTKH
jgi:hypothetical protein